MKQATAARKQLSVSDVAITNAELDFNYDSRYKQEISYSMIIWRISMQMSYHNEESPEWVVTYVQQYLAAYLELQDAHAKT